MRDRGMAFREGARLLIRSSVPEGKGVASSAALEVAVMEAVAAGRDASPTDAASRPDAPHDPKEENP